MKPLKSFIKKEGEENKTNEEQTKVIKDSPDYSRDNLRKPGLSSSKINLINNNSVINQLSPGINSPVKGEIKDVDQTALEPNSKRDLIPDEGYKGKDSLFKSIELEADAKAYMEEIENSNKTPKRFKDFLEISTSVKQQYTSIKNRLQIIDTLLCLTALVTIAIAIMDNDLIVQYYNIFEESYALSSNCNIYRSVLILFNLFGIILITKRYFYLLDVHKIQLGPIADVDTLSDAGLLGKLILEVFLHIIFIPPNVGSHFVMNGSIMISYHYDQVFNIDNLKFTNGTAGSESVIRSEGQSVKLYYNISTILTFFILFRVYHFFRLIYTFSYWATPRAHSICRLMNTQADVTFGIRAYLRIRPFISLMFSVCFVIVIFGVAVQLFEYSNASMMNALDADNNGYVQTMQKFANIYNSLWLILVTMTTIGYGDIYPTTYFGRVIAVLACIVGTFILSLLVVFLNNSISFDEIEKHVYNTVIEQEKNPIYLKKQASTLVGGILRYNYARKKHPENTALYRLYLWIEIKYNTQKFKLNRISSKKVEIDIDGILNDIKYKLNNGVTPVRNAFDEFNKTRITSDTSLANLKDSNHVSDKMLKNSMQMWNLLKVLNKDTYLEGLSSIDEVYDSQVNVIEEIVYYHNYRDKFHKEELLDEKNQKDDVNNSMNSSNISAMQDDISPNINNKNF